MRKGDSEEICWSRFPFFVLCLNIKPEFPFSRRLIISCLIFVPQFLPQSFSFHPKEFSNAQWFLKNEPFCTRESHAGKKVNSSSRLSSKTGNIFISFSRVPLTVWSRITFLLSDLLASNSRKPIFLIKLPKKTKGGCYISYQLSKEYHVFCPDCQLSNL